MQTPRHVLTTQRAAPRCPASSDGWHCDCPRVAGFGTDHPGVGYCRQHELAAAAATRAAHADRIPPAVFQEAVYVDGLPYPDTAPGTPAGDVYDEDDDPADEWETAA
ncbi:hypothetical protein ACFVJK_30790 [Streptomyces sp. NPDC127172]|uniref:hypothetical protein n=1 Tax=Streptomyces sp. NPDC127172 TaxID=3345382 RepID=UPI003626392E